MPANRWWCLLPISLLASCGGDDTRPGHDALARNDAPSPTKIESASAPVASRDATLAALRAAYVANVQKNAPPSYHLATASDRTVTGHNEALRASLRMTAAGLHLETNAEAGARSLDLELSGIGCAGDLETPSPAEPTATGNRIEVRREGVVEWYANGPVGLEQGFELEKAPACRTAGGGEVTIAVRMRGLAANLGDDGRTVLLRDGDGRIVFRYSDLHVVDATGRVLPSRLSVDGDDVLLHLDDTAAKYPISIDPILWSEAQKLLPTDGSAGDAFGSAVAIDGDTAVIGAPTDDDAQKGVDCGSAYVFVRDPVTNTWTQTQRLLSGDASATAGDNLGRSVAISGDLIAVGAPADNTGRGAVFVYQRSAVGVPFTQLQKLTASNAANGDRFGSAVAISGTSIIAGAPLDDNAAGSDAGSVYVYVKGASTFTQQANFAAGAQGLAGDEFGSTVAISGDTAVVGAYGDDSSGSLAGAAYVFLRTAGTWIQQAKFLPADGKANDRFGFSVALAGDTALIGAPLASTGTGTAYAYFRNAGAWMLQKKFTASDADAGDQFGHSVTIAGDVAIVGARADEPKGSNSGSAYVFTRNAGVWSEARKFVAYDQAGGDEVGSSVAVSGTLGIVGGAFHDGLGMDAGGAWFITPLEKIEDGQPCMKSTDCVSEICVDGVCCNSICGGGIAADCQACNVVGSLGTCVPVPMGTECRGPVGSCDAAEVCNGMSTDCPSDEKLMAGTECRPSAGGCDPAEVCDGVSDECPIDGLLAGGTICRASVGGCDIEEACDGMVVECPPDAVIGAGTVCRLAGGDCDVEDTCDGVSGACADAKQPAVTLCRAAAGTCDTAAFCDGTTNECPANAPLAMGVICRAPAGPCDLAETCDGVATTCPDDKLTPAGVSCGEAAGECSLAPVCDGTTTACSTGKDAVDGAMCTGGTCRAGECVPDPDGSGGGGNAGGAVPQPEDGCSCRAAGLESQTNSALWVGVGLGLLASVRRRRRS